METQTAPAAEASAPRDTVPRCPVCGAPMVPKPALASDERIQVCPNHHPNHGGALLDAYALDLEAETTRPPGALAEDLGARRFRRLVSEAESVETLPDFMLQDLPDEAKALLEQLHRPPSNE